MKGKREDERRRRKLEDIAGCLFESRCCHVLSLGYLQAVPGKISVFVSLGLLHFKNLLQMPLLFLFCTFILFSSFKFFSSCSSASFICPFSFFLTRFTLCLSISFVSFSCLFGCLSVPFLSVIPSLQSSLCQILSGPWAILFFFIFSVSFVAFHFPFFSSSIASRNFSNSFFTFLALLLPENFSSLPLPVLSGL